MIQAASARGENGTIELQVSAAGSGPESTVRHTTDKRSDNGPRAATFPNAVMGAGATVASDSQVSADSVKRFEQRSPTQTIAYHAGQLKRKRSPLAEELREAGSVITAITAEDAEGAPRKRSSLDALLSREIEA